MLNSPQQFLSGLASNSYPAQGYPHHQGTPPQPIIPYSSAACASGGGTFHHTILSAAAAGRIHSAAAMMQQAAGGGGGAGFGMVARAALMPTPGNQPHAGVNGAGGHHPPPHPHHPVSLGLEVRFGAYIKIIVCMIKQIGH